jgi:hypothetical protein
MHHFVRSLAPLVLVLVLALAAPASAAGAAPEPVDRHCSMTIIGQKSSGEYVTTPVVCRSGSTRSRMSIASTVIAFHYMGANLTGSSLAVYGTACTGGYYNLPPGWDNVVTSTWSFCTVDHYDGDNGGGTVETIAGSGNLTYMDNRTNSARLR